MYHINRPGGGIIVDQGTQGEEGGSRGGEEEQEQEQGR